MTQRLSYLLTLLTCAILVVACASKPPERPEAVPVASDSTPTAEQPVAEIAPRQPSQPPVAAEPEPASKVAPDTRMGTGVFVRQPAEPPAEPPSPEVGDVTLNFEGSSLREFAKVVLEDVLGENYLLDPRVDGVVTLHTTRPVARDAVLPIFESVLQQNAAALVRDQGILKIIPLANAQTEAGSPVVGRRPAPRGLGYATQIVPLQHVAASELEKILQPFIPQGGSLRTDPARNLLILSGPRFRLAQVLETIQIFDVDWLEGMSFGLYPLDYVDATTLVQELQQVLGEGQGPLAGIARLVPVDRLNAVLVISHQPGRMAQIRELIEQFDWGTEETTTPGRRLYVYNLENGKAANIATVLQELYAVEAAQAEAAPPATQRELAPGLQPSVFRMPNEVSAPPPPVGAAGQGGDFERAPSRAEVRTAVTNALEETPAEAAGESQGPVTIMADEDNNALLIMATRRDYRTIEAAIRRLDIAPRQVLIAATIAEVTLNDNLDYGVNWFIDTQLFGVNTEVGLDAPPPGGAGGDGLTLALLNSANEVRFFFDLLEAESSVKFLAAPNLMVLDNQAATINVGDQIPVTVRSSQSTSDPDAPIVTEVQFRDTGVLLAVTPRINAGGQVTMEISQEVSLPGTEPAVGGGGNVSIAQRTIDSTVIVQSGQTVVLGGLIRETRNDSRTGIPVLMNMPVFGPMFSSTSEDVNRTELIITISPTVIHDQQAALAVTEELRTKLQRASRFSSSIPH